MTTALVRRQFTDSFSAGIGAGYRVTRIEQDHTRPWEDNTLYGFAFVPAEATLDTRNDLLDPTKGVVTSVSFAPYFGTMTVKASAELEAGKLTAKTSLAGAGKKELVVATVNLPVRLSLAPTTIFVLPPAGALSGRLTANGDLTDVAGLLAQANTRLVGQIAADLALSGTLAAPDVTGSAQITASRLENADSGLVLRDLTLRVEAAGGTISLTKATASDLKGGTLNMTGSVGPLTAADAPVTITAKLHHLKVAGLDLVSATADGTIAVTGTLAQLKVGGALTIGPAEINLPTSLPPSVVVIPVTVVNDPAAKPAKPKSGPPAAARRVDIDYTVSLGQSVYIRGMKQAAATCARARRFEELRDRFVELLARDEAGYNPFLALANELLVDRRYTAAVALFRQAQSLAPDNTAIELGLAKAYHFLREPQLARKALEKCLEANTAEAPEVQALYHRLTGRRLGDLPTMDRARSTSPPKSAWPGVSMMLILTSFQITEQFFAAMVMPRSRSRSMAVVPPTIPDSKAATMPSVTPSVRAKSSALTKSRRIRPSPVMVPVNPWRGIPPFAEEEYVKHVPSADDLNRVLAAAEPCTSVCAYPRVSCSRCHYYHWINF